MHNELPSSLATPRTEQGNPPADACEAPPRRPPRIRPLATPAASLEAPPDGRGLGPPPPQCPAAQDHTPAKLDIFEEKRVLGIKPRRRARRSGAWRGADGASGGMVTATMTVALKQLKEGAHFPATWQYSGTVLYYDYPIVLLLYSTV